jgi:hypothetical protein
MILLWWFAAAMAAPIAADEAVVNAALRASPEVAIADAAVDRAEAELVGGARASRSTRRSTSGWASAFRSTRSPSASPCRGAARASRRRPPPKPGCGRPRRPRRASACVVAADARRALVTAIVADATLAMADELLTLTVTLRTAAEARRQAGEVPATWRSRSPASTRPQRPQTWSPPPSVAHTTRSMLARLTGLPWDVELPPDPEAALPAEVQATAERRDLRSRRTPQRRRPMTRSGASAPPSCRPCRSACGRRRRTSACTLGADGVVIPSGSASNTAWTVGPSLTVTLPVFKANPAGRGEAAADARGRDRGRPRSRDPRGGRSGAGG